MNVYTATCLAGLIAAIPATATPAAAAEDGQFSEPSQYSPMPQSFRAGRCVTVPPYGPLPIRIYTTPQLGPYYNVPPYSVIAPY